MLSEKNMTQVITKNTNMDEGKNNKADHLHEDSVSQK